MITNRDNGEVANFAIEKLTSVYLAGVLADALEALSAQRSPVYTEINDYVQRVVSKDITLLQDVLKALHEE